ncbi:MAG: carboxypeptidase regulatory-like domain-containing protein [Acidobacteriia bacterium]|nr:carboxypeptidase regulatory-like domain-containing protein [Terriglobia bacterium]
MKFLSFTRGLLLIALFVSLGTFAFAQEATILGTVTDPSGAAVPDVKVTLTNTETGITTNVTGSSDGQYVVPNLHIGPYIVRATAPGFKVEEKKGITLQVADRTRVDFKLQVGSTQETITVEANAAVVQTDTGEVSSMVTGQQISKLAANGRSVFALEALTPGASSVQGDFMVPTSAGSDFNVSFNGQRVVHNLWLIDGGEAADRGGGGGSDVAPSMESIAEFRALTSNYSAEYGTSSAGTMTMVIKSGTKAFHASAFYNGRNDALDARNFFNPAPNKVAELRFHDFGFNVGGPVSLHPNTSNPKTFFFYNMDWRRYIHGGLFNVNVPLASMYPNGAGDVVLPATDPGGTAITAVAPLLTTIPASIQYANCPGGVAPAGVTPGAAFPNNTIPACMVSPNAVALLGAGIFPKPTSGWAFIGGGNQPTFGREEIVRIDHRFTDKFSVFGHYIQDSADQNYGTTMWSGDNMPSVGNTFGNPSYHYVVHATHAINPNVLNEIAFNYNGNRIHILPDGVYKAPSGFTFNRIFTGENALNRIPSINLAKQMNDNYTANWVPWNNTADDYQIRDDVSWVKGAHQLKFGFSWAIYKKVQDYFASTQGGFTFDASATGFDYADFILGAAQGYNENAFKGTGHWNAINPAAYIQDNWRVNNRLTLNLGLRWDGMPHTYEANNAMGNFYPNLYDPAQAAVFVKGTNGGQIASNSPGLGTSPLKELQGYQLYLNGIGLEGKNGVPKGLAKGNWWDFGPRFGFAYDVTGSGKTVVRGGFGVMYERIQGNDMYNGATNPPFGYSLNSGNVLLANPHTTWQGGAITVPIVPAGVTGISEYYPTPRVSQYSIGVQQQVTNRAVLSVSYVGAIGRHLSYWQELNRPDPDQLASLTSTANHVGTDGVSHFNELVPYKGFTQLRQAFNGANSHYNSLQVELHGRVQRDLQLQVAYTYAKAIDPANGSTGNGWDLNSVTNPYVGWTYDAGPSALDRSNVAFVNFVYDIPLLKSSSNRAAKTLLGGWALSGIVSMQTGTPLNMTVSGNNVASLFSGGVGNRPDLSGTISYPKSKVLSPTGQAVGIQWVDVSAFTPPAAGKWGNLPFDALRGPGRNNWNLSLFKQFVFNESRGSAFEFRVDAFNAWNHTQFGGAGQNGGFHTGFDGGQAGQVTSAFDPRTLQLGAKLIF